MPRPVASAVKVGKSAYELIKETVLQFIEDDTFRVSAALSFYTAFSLAPLLLIVVWMVGLFYGQAVA